MITKREIHLQTGKDGSMSGKFVYKMGLSDCKRKKGGRKGTNYGTSLYFLFEAYRKIKNIGSYDDELCIIT